MQAQKYSIKQWAKDDRPREKLRSIGIQALSNAELLAIVLQSGTQSQSATELGRSVMRAGSNNLAVLGRFSIEDLQRVKGIGEARAMAILASFELGRRRQVADPESRDIIHSSSEMANYLQAIMQDYRHEVFGVVFLNRANKVNHFEIISQGGIAATVVDIRIILRKALEYDAVNLVLCHNHPSGNLKPSAADEELTEKIQQAASLFQMRVLDHLIISQEGYFSFADEGMITK